LRNVGAYSYTLSWSRVRVTDTQLETNTTLLDCNRVFGRFDVARMCKKIGQSISGFIYPILTQVSEKSYDAVGGDV
jgi:hypothetical protein